MNEKRHIPLLPTQRVYCVVMYCFSFFWFLGAIWGLSVQRLMTERTHNLALNLGAFFLSLVGAVLIILIVRKYLIGRLFNMPMNEITDFDCQKSGTSINSLECSTDKREKAIYKPRNHVFTNFIPPDDGEKQKSENK